MARRIRWSSVAQRGRAAVPAFIFLLGPDPLLARPLALLPGQVKKEIERIVPFVPTPMEIVKTMLELAKVDPSDTVYDLGSGDGRIVIMAAQRFGAQAVGVELDGKLFEQSSARIAELGLEQRARILHENMFDEEMVNYRRATVVTLFLLPSVVERLRPLLERQLKPGTRVVCHEFEIARWKPDKVVEVKTKDGSTRKLFLYIRP